MSLHPVNISSDVLHGCNFLQWLLRLKATLFRSNELHQTQTGFFMQYCTSQSLSLCQVIRVPCASRRLIPVLLGPATIMPAAPHRVPVWASAAPVLQVLPDPPAPSQWTSAPSTHALMGSAAASALVIGVCVYQVRISLASAHSCVSSLHSLQLCLVAMATASCVLRAQTSSLSVKCDCTSCAAESVYPLISPRFDKRCPMGPNVLRWDCT